MYVQLFPCGACFYEVGTLHGIVKDKEGIQRFALAACFKIIKEDKSNIIPAGMTKLVGTDVQRQATRGHYPSMITFADQYLRRINPLAHKEGMPLLLDMPTEQIRSLIVEPGKLLHFL